MRSQAEVFIAGLLARLLDQEDRERWRPGVERFLAYFNFWGPNLPELLLKFLFKTRYVNGLFKVVREGTLTRTIAPPLKKFLAELQKLAERER